MNWIEEVSQIPAYDTINRKLPTLFLYLFWSSAVTCWESIDKSTLAQQIILYKHESTGHHIKVTPNTDFILPSTAWSHCGFLHTGIVCFSLHWSLLDGCHDFSPPCLCSLICGHICHFSLNVKVLWSLGRVTTSRKILSSLFYSGFEKLVKWHCGFGAFSSSSFRENYIKWSSRVHEIISHALGWRDLFDMIRQSCIFFFVISNLIYSPSHLWFPPAVSLQ